jgi:hypothetical protein
MHDVPIIDQPQWPKYDTVTYPATVTFTLAFTKLDEAVTYDDPNRQYRFTGFKALAQLEASVDVPSINFSWKSDPLETSHANFAVIGQEVNGRYYAQASP